MGGDAHRLAQGCQFRILVSLRVFWAKCHIKRKVLFKGCMRRNIKKLYIFNSGYLLNSCDQSLNGLFQVSQKGLASRGLVFLMEV